jgi:hypothetical protein
LDILLRHFWQLAAKINPLAAIIKFVSADICHFRFGATMDPWWA